jgi:hypothetical protein
MSIKTIDRQDTGTKGVEKRIDAGAEKLVYDISTADLNILLLFSPLYES